MRLRIAPKRAKDDSAMATETRNNPETSGAPGGGIARTGATGGAMLPALVAWSSSLSADLQFAAWDVVGSAAHVTMLGRVGLVAAEDARALRGALLEALRQPSLPRALELDVSDE